MRIFHLGCSFGEFLGNNRRFVGLFHGMHYRFYRLGRAGQREAVQQTRLPTSTVEPHISPAPRDNATNRSEIVQAALWLTQTAQTYLPPALRSTLPQPEPSNERPSIHYGAMPIKLPSRRSRGLTLTTTNGFILRLLKTMRPCRRSVAGGASQRHCGLWLGHAQYARCS
jgi:hypothetical protein